MTACANHTQTHRCVNGTFRTEIVRTHVICVPEANPSVDGRRKMRPACFSVCLCGLSSRFKHNVRRQCVRTGDLFVVKIFDFWPRNDFSFVFSCMSWKQLNYNKLKLLFFFFFRLFYFRKTLCLLLPSHTQRLLWRMLSLLTKYCSIGGGQMGES